MSQAAINVRFLQTTVEDLVTAHRANKVTLNSLQASTAEPGLFFANYNTGVSDQQHDAPCTTTPPSPSTICGPKMVRIEPGAFAMGGTEESESPSHLVQITRPFAIAKHETTFEEYDRFANATGRQLPKDKGWGRGARPVINVSWEDANAYAAWLSRQTGESYRLPTEAEWEYAARSGGVDTKWAGTSDMGELKNFAVYESKQTEPVGSKQPNKLGLYDMSGNVWEWVADVWHDNYEGAPMDGSAWMARSSDNPARRVLRGGSWDNRLEHLRVSRRGGEEPELQFGAIGFRLVKDLPSPERK